MGNTGVADSLWDRKANLKSKQWAAKSILSAGGHLPQCRKWGLDPEGVLEPGCRGVWNPLPGRKQCWTASSNWGRDGGRNYNIFQFHPTEKGHSSCVLNTGGEISCMSILNSHLKFSHYPVLLPYKTISPVRAWRRVLPVGTTQILKIMVQSLHILQKYFYSERCQLCFGSNVRQIFWRVYMYTCVYTHTYTCAYLYILKYHIFWSMVNL